MLAALSLLLLTFVYGRFHPQKSGAATMAPELVAIKAPKHRPPPPLPEEELEPLELHAGPPMRMSSTNERPVARLPARIRSCIGIGRQRPEARPLNQRILVDSTKVWLGDPSRISTRILTSMPASTGIERGLPR